MNTDPIFTAVNELREVAGDGPATRKVVDKLFRHVHNLKANASANGLNQLAAAAHEVENVLHTMRAGAIAEGARLFIVQANFDVADFDQKFQILKETLSNTGEVLSTTPSMSNEYPGKLNFKILYAETNDAVNTLSNIPDLIVEEITPTQSATMSDLEARASLERAFKKLSEEIGKLSGAPFGNVFEQTVLAGRSAALALGKNVDIEVRGQDLELDDELSETIRNALVHLVRNAVDHGIEAGDERVKLGKNPRGKIVIEVASLEGRTRITVTDDGRGIDPALIQEIFRTGFSTANDISEISGRGVGLDAVKTGIEESGGSINVTSQLGHGSTFEITISPNSPLHPR